MASDEHGLVRAGKLRACLAIDDAGDAHAHADDVRQANAAFTKERLMGRPRPGPRERRPVKRPRWWDGRIDTRGSVS